MNKKITSILLILSFVFSTHLFAEKKEVPKVKKSEESYIRKNWQPWAVAIVTIAIAATYLLLKRKKIFGSKKQR